MWSRFSKHEHCDVAHYLLLIAILFGMSLQLEPSSDTHKTQRVAAMQELRNLTHSLVFRNEPLEIATQCELFHYHFNRGRFRAHFDTFGEFMDEIKNSVKSFDAQLLLLQIVQLHTRYKIEWSHTQCVSGWAFCIPLPVIFCRDRFVDPEIVEYDLIPVGGSPVGSCTREDNTGCSLVSEENLFRIAESAV